MWSSPKEAKRYVDSFQRNKPLDGACVGQIIESKNNEFTVGECVLGNYCSSELKRPIQKRLIFILIMSVVNIWKQRLII